MDESGKEPGICIVEVCNPKVHPSSLDPLKLGGTVGDIESALFMWQFQFCVGHDNLPSFMCLVPDVHGEQKTKPTQTTVHSLRGLGWNSNWPELGVSPFILKAGLLSRSSF